MKQCPECQHNYPVTDRFCGVDGSPLIEVVKRTREKPFKLIALLAIPVICVLLIANSVPFLLEYAASNCEIALVGMDMGKKKILKDMAGHSKTSVEDIISILTGNTDKKKPGKKEQDITLVLTIHNKNPVSVTIESMAFTLNIKSSQLGKGRLFPNRVIEIPANGSTEVRASLTISLMDLFVGMGGLISLENIPYRVKGEAVVEALFFKVRYPFELIGDDLPLL